MYSFQTTNYSNNECNYDICLQETVINNLSKKCQQLQTITIVCQNWIHKNVQDIYLLSDEYISIYAYEAMLDSIYRVRFYNTLCVYLIFT